MGSWTVQLGSGTRRSGIFWLLLVLPLTMGDQAALAEDGVCFDDQNGRTISLPQPATRMVTIPKPRGVDVSGGRWGEFEARGADIGGTPRATKALCMWPSMILYPDKFDWPLRSILAEKYQKIYDHTPSEDEIDGILRISMNGSAANYGSFKRQRASG